MLTPAASATSRGVLAPVAIAALVRDGLRRMREPCAIAHGDGLDQALVLQDAPGAGNRGRSDPGRHGDRPVTALRTGEQSF